MQQELASFDPRPGLPLQHQITAFLRDLITRGVLPPGTRLPNIRDLATHWHTNYFTVQAALVPLINERLLCSRPRLGTHVQKPADCLGAVGLYQCAQIGRDAAAEYHHLLNTAVYERLAHEGVSCHAWFDTRPPNQQTTPLPAVEQALREGQVQAIVAPLITAFGVHWLQRLSVPASCHSSLELDGCVKMDEAQLMRLALDALVAQGCRRIGMISHVRLFAGPEEGGEMNGIYRRLLHEATRRGLTIDRGWLPEHTVVRTPSEEFGFLEIHRLARDGKLPEGLIVFPDVLTHGVFQAILQLGIEVPGKLRLVCHRTAERHFFAPFPTTWITLSVNDVADALIDQLKRQLRREPAPCQLVPLRLERHQPRAPGTSAELG